MIVLFVSPSNVFMDNLSHAVAQFCPSASGGMAEVQCSPTPLRHSDSFSLLDVDGQN